MQINPEKVAQAIDALHAAEKALLATDTTENCIVAGQCAVSAVMLETSVKMAGVDRVVHLTGEPL